MRSSKPAATENNRGISGHMYTLHHRLYQALNLGTRCVDSKGWKWQCTDIEIQRHVLRSIAAFLDSISPHTSHHPLVKDSMAAIVGALVWILQHKSETVVNIAANLVVKLISIMPNSVIESHLLDLIHPLSSLLCFRQLQVSISCAIALNMILLNLSGQREGRVWGMLIRKETVLGIVSNILEYSSGKMSIEYFQEMASLLSTILHQWPPSRYPVWNDNKLMELLEVLRLNPDFSVKAAVLKLYCGLALCGNGAKKLLENGESLLKVTVLCISRSHPISVRIEGFRLAQCLAKNEQGYSKMMGLCCEPLVKALVDGMTSWTSSSGKISNDHMFLLVEACRLALIVCWAGEYVDCFWRQGIDKVLLGLLLENFVDGPFQHFSSLEEQISRAEEGLQANFLLVLRPYVWDILGWLATHCREDFNPSIHSHELHTNMLIICACLSFADSIRKGRQICQNDVADTFRGQSASRAVLMMIYSPCKCIASKARFILSEILQPTGQQYLKHLLHCLNSTLSHDNFDVSHMLQTAINLVALTCYSCFPQYQNLIIRSGGIETLMTFTRCYYHNNVHIGRLKLASHLPYMFNQRTCCWVCKEDWEGDNTLLLYGLWGLAELIHSGSITNNLDIFAGHMDYTEAQFVSMLKEICSDSSAIGVKWYAAYILSYFGLYGFPCKLGRRIGKALKENEYADMQLILAQGDSMTVHGVVLAIRCPALLPPEESPLNGQAFDGSSVINDTEKPGRKFQKEIRLSSHVDNLALAKLLEFVYLGYLQAGEDLVKKLKILAKHCSLQPLLIMLGRIRPKWGALFPSYDLALALTSAGHRFSDIILEAKTSESISWSCSVCSISEAHMHAHKVILCSSCDFLRALFQSGMQESHSQILKVPVSWEALVKLVNWFYTDELPNLLSGCLWDNMDNDERLNLLQPYLELCWLAEYWFLEEVQDISHRVIVSCLDSARHLAIRVIKIAADFSLWKLAEVAADYLSPFYRQLCHSGDLEELDEELVDMIRAASVRLSQEA